MILYVCLTAMGYGIIYKPCIHRCTHHSMQCVLCFLWNDCGDKELCKSTDGGISDQCCGGKLYEGDSYLQLYGHFSLAIRLQCVLHE